MMEINEHIGKILFFWSFGFLYSLLLGHMVVKSFLKYTQYKALKRLGEHYHGNQKYPRKVIEKALEEIAIAKENFRIEDVAQIGHVERVFFTLLAAISPLKAPTLMIIWIGVKIVRNWQASKMERSFVSAVLSVCSLSCNLLSMTVAFICGLICNAWRLNF